jgi:GTP-binding protein HflX
LRAEEHQAERTLLVHLEGVRPDEQADAAEFLELALSAGADVVQMCQVMLQQPAARYLIGTGKVGELASLVAELGVELVIFSHDLTPSQERNLERALGCRVVDRIGLILDIFSQRAHTHEGKLQVELAQLEHISTRLVRSRTDLSRQQGGIGLRGPGETQLGK